jgi:predicted GNAT superfamily acetyltransferase
MAVWPASSENVAHGPPEVGPLTTVLSVGARGEPVIASPAGNALVCEVPVDIVAVRRDTPERAQRWRMALRETMGAALDDGYLAAGMTEDASYILAREVP